MSLGPRDPIVGHLLKAEGWPAYTDHPADRGGPTKGGITLATLREHRGGPVSAADLRALGEDEARAIYFQRYLKGPGFDGIGDELLRWQAVDAGVLSGPSRAARWLQEAAGVVPADGKVGPKTLAAVNGQDAHRVSLRLCAARTRGLMRIVAGDATQAVWAAGWANRALSFLDKEAAR
jgi:lysozyme family protein